MPTEVPVYLFTGFLDSGKTTFIQEVLQEEGFNEDERTLLLLCEDGETEYDPSRFYDSQNVFFEWVDEEEELTTDRMAEAFARHRCTRVIVEWNGMWDLNRFYGNAPEDWLIYQQTMFADAGTFLLYNENIRQRTFEQMKGAELIVFNRCKRSDDFEDWQLKVHKICRVANRRNQIVYEFGENDLIMDDIKDPLPYDMSKDLLLIEEWNYAEWYRDINENQDNYQGKEVIIKGRVALGQGETGAEEFIFGRHLMTCCEEDIEFAGLLAKWEKENVRTLENGQWVQIRAFVNIEYSKVYRETGPVLYCSQVDKTEPCKPEVATF